MDKKDKKSKGKALANTARKTTPKAKPTAIDAKSKGKAKVIPPSPALDTVPTSDGEEDEGASDDEDNDDETKLSSASKPTTRQLGNLHPSKSLEVTLFDRMEKMWGGEIKQMLTVQYR